MIKTYKTRNKRRGTCAELTKLKTADTGLRTTVLYDSFGIGAQTVGALSLSLQDAVNNVSSVNEHIKSTVATIKQHYNMKEAAAQMVSKELYQRKHMYRSRWNSSNKVWHDCKIT